MKLATGEVTTTTELMKDLFGMEDALIYNMTEKARYERLYSYLTKSGAEELGKKEVKGNSYLVFEMKEDLYLIPNKLFDELNEEWVEELKSSEESEAEEVEVNPVFRRKLKII